MRQFCDDPSDTVLIKNNGVAGKWNTVGTHRCRLCSRRRSWCRTCGSRSASRPGWRDTLRAASTRHNSQHSPRNLQQNV